MPLHCSLPGWKMASDLALSVSSLRAMGLVDVDAIEVVVLGCLPSAGVPFDSGVGLVPRKDSAPGKWPSAPSAQRW